MSFLQIKELSISFGGLQALAGVNFEVGKNEIVGIIGPNGAGKTTLFNCICRLYEPTQGSIVFQGQELLRYGPHDLARLGIARTFQNLELFNHLTVFENVLIGGHCRINTGLWIETLGFGRATREEKKARRKAEELLELSGLTPIKDRKVAELPFGQLKMVEFARALAIAPELLLLDEPSAGMSAEEMENLKQVLLGLKEKRGISILLVAHHLEFVMGISDKVVVLNFGQKIAEGSPREVAKEKAVIEAYLGTKRRMTAGVAS